MRIVVVLPDGTKAVVRDGMTKVVARTGAELVSSANVSVSALRDIVDAVMASGKPPADLDGPAFPASGASPRTINSRCCPGASPASTGILYPRRFGRGCWSFGSSCCMSICCGGRLPGPRGRPHDHGQDHAEAPEAISLHLHPPVVAKSGTGEPGEPAYATITAPRSMTP